jgi:hypothetical protein|tara:strand:- start:246 stop:476 length:231 start_codon:yes stop_codon:yes gene_type:complete
VSSDMQIERDERIVKIKFDNDLEFELGEMNQNENSDYYLELVINIVENVNNNYTICFVDRAEFYSFEFDQFGNEID